MTRKGLTRASQTKSKQRGVDRREARDRASTRSDHDRVEPRTLIPARYCAVCFLTFGSQERRIFEGNKVAHQGCVERLREPNVA